MEEGSIAIRAATALSFAEAEERVRETLADEGFGVLTEIDVAATPRDRIGVEMEPYRILGACNPPLAHRALEEWRGFGLLVPCNVVVQDAGDHRVLLAFDPLSVPQVREHIELLETAREVRARLERELRAVERAAPAAAQASGS